MNERPPLFKVDKQDHQQSARLPPTYQSTSASKKSAINVYTNPISTSNSKNYISAPPFNPVSQYTTGSFPPGDKGELPTENNPSHY